MVDRQVHGVRNSRGGVEGGRIGADLGDQEEDSRPQRRAPLRDRYRGAEADDQSGRRLRSLEHGAGGGVNEMNLHAKPDHELEVRRDQVWACLESVMDPELDESVTELNFVTRADVDENNRVHIEFRLPTYWCAANFSFLMADDMRRAVSALSWVESVSVVLGEHMYADKISAGLAEGLSFQETFGADADGSLDDLRQTFL